MDILNVDILNCGGRIIRDKLLAVICVGTGVFYAYPSVSGVWLGKDDLNILSSSPLTPNRGKY